MHRVANKQHKKGLMKMKNFKRALALALALLMVVCLVACSSPTDDKDGDDDVSAAPSPSAPATENTDDDNTGNTQPSASATPADTSKVGYYDDPVDHQARDKYNFVYCFTASSALTDAYITAFNRMSAKYNFSMTQCTGEGDPEAYIQNLEVVLDDGVDGIILDCNPTISGRVYEILGEYDTPYVAILNPLYDEEGHNLAPVVMLDNYAAGYESVKYYGENYKKYWGNDVEITDNIGLLNMGWSTSPPFVERVEGANKAFLEYFPQGQVIEADGVATGQLNSEGGYDIASQFISANPDIEYWIVFAVMEDYAQGAARFSETTAFADKFLITNVGNQLLPREFEAGYKGAWYCSYGVPNIAYAGPAICGLIAMADGRATADTLWADQRIEGDLGTRLYADPVMVTIDNYTTFMDDIYALYE